MISNQVLQTTIDGLKNITRIDICVMDTEGKALATTINNVEEYEDAVMAFVESPADSQVLQGYQFFKVFDDHQLEYVILAKGDSDDVYMVGKLAAFQIQNLLVAYKERYDKDNFIKNLHSQMGHADLVHIRKAHGKPDCYLRRILLHHIHLAANITRRLGDLEKDFIT